MAAGWNMYGDPSSSLYTSAGQSAAVGTSAALGWASVGLGAFNIGLSIIGGALNASAQRQQAMAQMSALKKEKAYNLGVMQQNKIDTYASNLLSAYGSGIKGSTGSTAAVIASNQNILQNEINFQEQQYNTQLKNLKAQSKQKYLGIF